MTIQERNDSKVRWRWHVKTLTRGPGQCGRSRSRPAWVALALAVLTSGLLLSGCLGLSRKVVKLDELCFTISQDFDFKASLEGGEDYVFVYRKDSSSPDSWQMPISIVGPLGIEELERLVPPYAKWEESGEKKVAEFTVPASETEGLGEALALVVKYNERLAIIYCEPERDYINEARKIADSLTIRKE